MIKKEKKGLSYFLIIFLIVILFLLILGTLFIAFKGLIKRSSVPIGESTINLNMEKAQLVDNNLSLTLKRNQGEGEFIGLDFLVEDEDNSELFTEYASINELEMRTFIFTLKEINPDNQFNVTIIPILKLKSDRKIRADKKYVWESSSGMSRCTSNCIEKECGSDGCKGNCGECSEEMVCSLGKCVIGCVDTCSSLGHECGEVCGENCGSCINEHGSSTCVNGKCQPVCDSGWANCNNNTRDGCETKLGTITDCSSCYNICVEGYVCTNRICSLPCKDSCASLNYSCGIQTICGGKILCGVCSSGYTCSTNGVCIKQ